MKIALGIIALIIVTPLLIYGTLSPCEIFKKEVAKKAGEKSEQGLYILFGGFIERSIDTLNPIQCLNGLYKIKTQGVDAGLNNLLK